MNAGAGPRVPPRFVPTLTEVVQPSFAPPAVPEPAEPGPQAAGAAPQPGMPAVPARAAVEQFEDQIIHRVMQRVDVALERSLHDAVAAMVLQHTHALVPRLREEIEFVVRQAVADAVARELAGRQP